MFPKVYFLQCVTWYVCVCVCLRACEHKLARAERLCVRVLQAVYLIKWYIYSLSNTCLIHVVSTHNVLLLIRILTLFFYKHSTGTSNAVISIYTCVFVSFPNITDVRNDSYCFTTSYILCYK